jgi:SAM-dependent methyltransferase
MSDPLSSLVARHSSLGFDAAAATYDADFSERRLGRWLRQAVQAHLGALFAPGDRVLELGCGTGEDALWLARRGVRVTATDASPAMLDITRGKVQAQSLQHLVETAQLDMAALAEHSRLTPGDPVLSTQPSVLSPQHSTQPSVLSPQHSTQSSVLSPQHSYDGCFSNFGALNCLVDRRPVAEALAGCVRPGGRVALVLMAPLCAWEIGWHLLRGDARRAFRRLRQGAVAHAGGGRGVRVWYPSPRRLARELAPRFRALETRAVGALLPPSYLAPLAERWPRLFAALALLDQKLPARAPWPSIADHYLMIFERSPRADA